MKKTLLFAFTSFILFSFTANITAQSSAESEGTVENSLLPTKIEVPERKTSSKNRGLSSLFYSGESSELGPLFYNEYNAFATNVKESEGIIIYEYDDDEIALKVSKYLNMYLCFDRKARSAVRLGASFFRDDITSGALSSKNKNSYKAYGETTEINF